MSSRALTGSDQDVADDSEANAMEVPRLGGGAPPPPGTMALVGERADTQTNPGLPQMISSNRETLTRSQLRCAYPGSTRILG